MNRRKPQAAQQRHKVQSVAEQLKREQGAIVINSYGKDARHAREAHADFLADLFFAGSTCL